ncbi:MAG: hypothetical protein ACI83H_001171 [Glaciecola sp.]|jgi:hypothetical protein
MPITSHKLIVTNKINLEKLKTSVTKWQIQLPIKYDEHKKDYRIIKHFTIQDG